MTSLVESGASPLAIIKLHIMDLTTNELSVLRAVLNVVDNCIIRDYENKISHEHAYIANADNFTLAMSLDTYNILQGAMKKISSLP